MLTLWCVIVVCGSILAAGTPLRWLLNSRQPLTSAAWLEVPFYGIAGIILVVQNLVYLDVPISRSTWILWALVVVSWIWMGVRGGIAPSLRTIPQSAFAVAGLAYVAQGIGLLIVGARDYVGRAWGDQFNYTVMAQFLTDLPFSTRLADVADHPFMAAGLRFKFDRIGQSVLHGFFATTSVTDAKTMFEPTILLSPLLVTLAIVALARRYGVGSRIALAGGLSAGLLPAIALVHLESFLSQALATPLLLMAPVLIDEVAESPTLATMIGTALLFAATASLYSELMVVLLVIAVVGIMLTAASRPRRARAVVLTTVLVLTLAFNVRFTVSLFRIFGRVDLPVLANLYPWALSVEGVVRVWLGDLGANAKGMAQSLVRAYALALTGLGYYGLIRSAVVRTTGSATGGTHPGGRGLPWMTLAVALLPAVVFARDDAHPYQFYKLFLTIAPLLAIGVTVALARLHGLTRVTGTESGGVRWAGTAAWALWATMFAGLGAATVGMALESTRQVPTFRSNAHYLLNDTIRDLRVRLSALRGERLFINATDETWNHGLLNGWLAYYARHNKVWLGNPALNDADLQGWPELRDAIAPSAFPRGMLVLTGPDLPIAAWFAPPATRIWSVGGYDLWRAPGDWFYPLAVDNKNGIDGTHDKPTLWLGGGATTIQMYASRGGDLQIIANVLNGPALQGRVLRVKLWASTGYDAVVEVGEGMNVLSVPVRIGRNEIRLEPLDRAAPPVAGGDQRPLVLGLQEPRLTLDNAWALLLRTINNNGVERLDDQPFFWMGQGPTTLEVLIGRAGLIRFDAEIIPGPSIPDDIVRRVRAVTDEGHSQTLVTRGGRLGLVLPIGKGHHTVTLYAMDPPLLHSPHDPRPLIVGLKNLSISVVDTPAAAAQNPRLFEGRRPGV